MRTFDLILDVISQFAGGRGGIENDLPRFGLAALFWGIILAFAIAKQRRERTKHEALLVWGFSLGLFRELFMFTITFLDIANILKLSDIHFFFPPFEHALSIGSAVLIAGAYMRYLLRDIDLSYRYILAGLIVTALSYLVTFYWWAEFIWTNPESRFGQTWADWLFRITAVILLIIPIYYIYKRREAGWIRTTILLALSFFFLDHFLMLFNLATDEVYREIFGPIRHTLHIFAIPLFGHVYYLEQRNIQDEMVEELKNSERRFRSFIEASSECISNIDLNGNIRFFSHFLHYW